MPKKMEESGKYADIIARIDERYKTMRNMRPLRESSVRRYNEELSISASYNSNAIEGNTFTYDETRLLLKEGVTSSARSFREHEEIVGFKAGFDFLYSSLKAGRIIDEDMIMQIHKFVLRGEEEAGEYRTEQVYIGDMLNVAYTPSAPRLIRSQMSEYIESLQADMRENIDLKKTPENFSWLDIFHNLAKHHIEFERIHPFIDGNGRTGRLLLIYEMISMGLLPIDIRYEERSRYYAGFKDYESKAKYGTRPESKTEGMAKLIAESELRSMEAWLRVFEGYIVPDSGGETGGNAQGNGEM